MTDYADHEYANEQVYGCGLMERPGSGLNSVYVDGLVATRWGYVSVYSEKISNRKYTRLAIIFDGRLYERRWRKYFTPRGLVTKARQFAEDKANDQ